MTTATEVVNGSELLTNSSLSCFKACRRMYFYAYEKGWKPQRDIEVLRLGQAIHYGVDALAKGWSIDHITQNLEDQYDDCITEAQTSLQEPSELAIALKYECQTVKALIEGYARAWAFSSIQILESEKVFRLPITNPETKGVSRTFEQGGRRDRLIKLPDGRIALGETKTTSEDISAGSDYRNVLTLNAQVAMYYNAVQAEGIDVQTTLYDCIRKPSIRPNGVAMTDENGLKIVLDANGQRVFKKDGQPRQTGSTDDGYVLQSRPMTPDEWYIKLVDDISARPEFYYTRFEVPLLETDIEQFKSELWDTAQDIMTCRNKSRWYRNTNSCRRFNRLCSYYGLCSGQIDASNGVPAGFRQSENAHEELSEE